MNNIQYIYIYIYIYFLTSEKVPVHKILERFPLGPGLRIRGSPPPPFGTPLGSGAVGTPPPPPPDLSKFGLQVLFQR